MSNRVPDNVLLAMAVMQATLLREDHKNQGKIYPSGWYAAYVKTRFLELQREEDNVR